jgi:hypothetical protein
MTLVAEDVAGLDSDRNAIGAEGVSTILTQ